MDLTRGGLLSPSPTPQPGCTKINIRFKVRIRVRLTYHIVNGRDPVVRVEKRPQAFHKTLLEGDQMDAHPVVGHRVDLGLQPGAGKRLVDVLLQVVEALLHRPHVRARHQGCHLVGELRMSVDDGREELDELVLGEPSSRGGELSRQICARHLMPESDPLCQWTVLGSRLVWGGRARSWWGVVRCGL